MGMQASIAHADQATNAIYAEKGQLVIHLGNVPDKYQKSKFPSGLTKMAKMT